jgi:hypothetical protein
VPVRDQFVIDVEDAPVEVGIERLTRLALYAMPVVSRADVVSWPPTAEEFLVTRELPTIDDYRHWVGTGAYSAVLADGALLQLTYECIGGEITAHRLAYVPSPFEMDQNLLTQEPILDVFDVYASGRPADVILATTIRFDYDPSSASADHPVVHLTINSPSCRIACASPLRIGRFIDFVFRHFYPNEWRIHPYLASLPGGGWGTRTLTESEAEGTHIAWRV